MAWNSQGGGPWGGGGGGGKGPWGQGPLGGGNGGGGPTPPDFDELIRKGQDRFKRLMPSGFGSVTGLVLVAVAVFLLWAGSGFYRVQPAERGVLVLFGKWTENTGPGLHWWFPAPIGGVEKVDVEAINRVDVGFRGGSGGRGNDTRDIPEESLMLTGDQNIADLDFTVLWRIKDAGDYLFNIRDPEGTVKVAAESAMREVIGQTTLQAALTGGRDVAQRRTQERLQEILDDYGSGITVNQVQLLSVDPPRPVIDSFNEVQRARQDKERKQNEAEAYRNKVVPVARGEAQRMIQGALAQRERMVQEAEGQAQRFSQVYESYLKAPDVTKRRLFLETMQEVLANREKVIIEGNESGVVPYLPLPELQKRNGTVTGGN